MKRLLLVFFLVLGVLIAAYPFESTIVPQWKLRVVDESGRAFSGARVVQQWEDYSLDEGGGEEKWADEDGYVVFPKRTVRSSLLFRMVRTSWALVMKLAHGTTGIRASVWATTERASSEPVEYAEGKPLPDKIVLRQ